MPSSVLWTSYLGAVPYYVDAPDRARLIKEAIEATDKHCADGFAASCGSRVKQYVNFMCSNDRSPGTWHDFVRKCKEGTPLGSIPTAFWFSLFSCAPESQLSQDYLLNTNLRFAEADADVFNHGKNAIKISHAGCDDFLGAAQADAILAVCELLGVHLHRSCYMVRGNDKYHVYDDIGLRVLGIKAPSDMKTQAHSYKKKSQNRLLTILSTARADISEPDVEHSCGIKDRETCLLLVRGIVASLCAWAKSGRGLSSVERGILLYRGFLALQNIRDALDFCVERGILGGEYVSSVLGSGYSSLHYPFCGGWEMGEWRRFRKKFEIWGPSHPICPEQIMARYRYVDTEGKPKISLKTDSEFTMRHQFGYRVCFEEVRKAYEHNDSGFVAYFEGLLNNARGEFDKKLAEEWCAEHKSGVKCQDVAISNNESQRVVVAVDIVDSSALLRRYFNALAPLMTNCVFVGFISGCIRDIVSSKVSMPPERMNNIARYVHFMCGDRYMCDDGENKQTWRDFVTQYKSGLLAIDAVPTKFWFLLLSCAPKDLLGESYLLRVIGSFAEPDLFVFDNGIKDIGIACRYYCDDLLGAAQADAILAVCELLGVILHDTCYATGLDGGDLYRDTGGVTLARCGKKAQAKLLTILRTPRTDAAESDTEHAFGIKDRETCLLLVRGIVANLRAWAVRGMPSAERAMLLHRGVCALSTISDALKFCIKEGALDRHYVDSVLGVPHDKLCDPFLSLYRSANKIRFDNGFRFHEYGSYLDALGKHYSRYNDPLYEQDVRDAVNSGTLSAFDLNEQQFSDNKSDVVSTGISAVSYGTGPNLVNGHRQDVDHGLMNGSSCSSVSDPNEDRLSAGPTGLGDSDDRPDNQLDAALAGGLASDWADNASERRQCVAEPHDLAVSAVSRNISDQDHGADSSRMRKAWKVLLGGKEGCLKGLGLLILYITTFGCVGGEAIDKLYNEHVAEHVMGYDEPEGAGHNIGAEENIVGPGFLMAESRSEASMGES